MLESIEVRYGRAIAVSGVSMSIVPGRITAVVGPNGAGKTSLFEAALGSIPFKGRVMLDGQDLSRLPTGRRIRAGLVLVPQGRQIFPRLTVNDNLRVIADAARVPFHQIEEALSLFPVLKLKPQVIAGALSGGEQQMLALARAVVVQPRILLLDEPTLGLAPKVIAEVMDKIQSLAAAGVGVAIAEPSIGWIRRYAARGYVLLRGQSVADAETSAELEQAYSRALGVRGWT